jgi:hypothetical protein
VRRRIPRARVIFRFRVASISSVSPFRTPSRERWFREDVHDDPRRRRVPPRPSPIVRADPFVIAHVHKQSDAEAFFEARFGLEPSSNDVRSPLRDGSNRAKPSTSERGGPTSAAGKKIADLQTKLAHAMAAVQEGDAATEQARIERERAAVAWADAMAAADAARESAVADAAVTRDGVQRALEREVSELRAALAAAETMNARAKAAEAATHAAGAKAAKAKNDKLAARVALLTEARIGSSHRFPYDRVRAVHAVP